MSPAYIPLFIAFGCGFSALVIIAAIVAIRFKLPFLGAPPPEAPPPPPASTHHAPTPWSGRLHD